MAFLYKCGSLSYILNKTNKFMEEQVIGYCVKCKEKREMKDVQKVEIKPGRPAAKGTCTVCGTGMYRILSSKK